MADDAEAVARTLGLTRPHPRCAALPLALTGVFAAAPNTVPPRPSTFVRVSRADLSKRSEQIFWDADSVLSLISIPVDRLIERTGWTPPHAHQWVTLLKPEPSAHSPRANTMLGLVCVDNRVLRR
jgi:hypothetical protein